MSGPGEQSIRVLVLEAHILIIPKHQYCHAREGKEDYCTPLQGKPDYELDKAWDTWFPEASDVQRTVLRTLIVATYLRDIHTVTTNRANTLMNRADGTIDSLPNDWWKEELKRHEAEVWASLQIQMSQYAIGPKNTDPLADNYVIPPTTPGQKALCKAQKMRLLDDFV